MGFRFRHSARLGPLRFNFAKGGLSSISVGGRGASFNIPVTRRGGPRTTVGLPGTGLSGALSTPRKQASHHPWALRRGCPTAVVCAPASCLPSSRTCLPCSSGSFSRRDPPGSSCGSWGW
jgi:hypothetical protein